MAILEFPAVYLLHGTGGSPEGSVRLLQAELAKCGAKQNYVRPLMPHSDPNVPPSESVQYLRDLRIPDGSLLVGISLGGLVAAKLQEVGRPDLHVICINSPTRAGETALHGWVKHRVSLYSSSDIVLAGRTNHWPLLTPEAHDIAWLDGHDIDPHSEALAHILASYMQAGLINLEGR